MDLEKIEKLVKIIENSSMLEFSVKEGDLEISMSRKGHPGQPAEVAVHPAAAPVPSMRLPPRRQMIS